jgi:hypothetical protein
MEYPCSVFMLKVKQGILYDHITERWFKLYVKKYIIYEISICDKVWYNLMGWGNSECKGTKNTKKGTSCN